LIPATYGPNGFDAEVLVHDMIEVHGAEAATIARNNARTAALAGRAIEAKSWIRVLAAIQQQRAARPANTIPAAVPRPRSP
jgi:hypothetical protein